MAVFSLSASSSSFMFSSSSTCSSSTKPPFQSSSSSSKSFHKTPLIGFSVPQSQKLWIPTTSTLTFDNESSARRSFEVHSAQEIARVPLDERWMFEDDEAEGIVCTHTHFLFSMYIYICKIGSIGCKESAFFFDLPKNFEL